MVFGRHYREAMANKRQHYVPLGPLEKSCAESGDKTIIYIVDPAVLESLGLKTPSLDHICEAMTHTAGSYFPSKPCELPTKT